LQIKWRNSLRVIWHARPAQVGSKGNYRYEQRREEEVKGMNIEVSANQKAAIEQLIWIARAIQAKAAGSPTSCSRGGMVKSAADLISQISGMSMPQSQPTW
jgi:hypothetical protein